MRLIVDCFPSQVSSKILVVNAIVHGLKSFEKHLILLFILKPFPYCHQLIISLSTLAEG